MKDDLLHDQGAHISQGKDALLNYVISIYLITDSVQQIHTSVCWQISHIFLFAFPNYFLFNRNACHFILMSEEIQVFIVVHTLKRITLSTLYTVKNCGKKTLNIQYVPHVSVCP